MLDIALNIAVGPFLFSQVNAIEISSSYKSIADTCKITLPFANGAFTAASDGSSIAIGDYVSVQAAYSIDGQTPVMQDLFTGFVSHIRHDIPVEIECEDYAYMLRKIDLPKRTVSSLHQLLNLILAQLPETSISTSTSDMRIGPFYLNYTAYDALEKLRKDYKLASFWRGKELTVGLPGSFNGRTHEFYHNQPEGSSEPNNIIPNSNRLDYSYAREKRLRVKVIGTDKSGKQWKRAEVVVGDPNGSLLTQIAYGVLDLAKLRQIGEAAYNERLYAGYEGSFVTLGYPVVKHSDYVNINDALAPETTVQHQVETVTTTISKAGWRQLIKVGPRTSVKK